MPRKTNIFIWRLRLNRLPTIDNLNYRGIVTPDALCPACKSYPDSAKHIFLECSTAKEVMARLACRWNKLPDLSNCTGVEDLISGRRDTSLSKTDVIKYEVIIRAYLWTIWNNMNDICFNNTVKTIPILVSEILGTVFYGLVLEAICLKICLWRTCCNFVPALSSFSLELAVVLVMNLCC